MLFDSESSEKGERGGCRVCVEIAMTASGKVSQRWDVASLLGDGRPPTVGEQKRQSPH